MNEMDCLTVESGSDSFAHESQRNFFPLRFYHSVDWSLKTLRGQNYRSHFERLSNPFHSSLHVSVPSLVISKTMGMYSSILLGLLDHWKNRTDRLSRNFGNKRYTLRNILEDRRSQQVSCFRYDSFQLISKTWELSSLVLDTSVSHRVNDYFSRPNLIKTVC
jgi:hypothetical protein